MPIFNLISFHLAFFFVVENTLRCSFRRRLDVRTLPVHVNNVFEPQVKDVVGYRLAAKFVHQFQIVEAVGHGKWLVGGYAGPIDQVRSVKGQQAEQRHPVAEVAQLAQFGEVRHVLSLRAVR